MKTKLFCSLLGIALFVIFASCTTSENKPYPLKKCLVSGEELGSMGEPVSIVYKGQTIKFCCKSCIKEFNESPENFLSKLSEMEKSK